jgi:hypothetical protein
MMIFFNEKYNFWPVYESIKRFYPIGCMQDWELIYRYREFDYPGVKELGTIIEENIHNESNFSSRWGTIENEIEKVSGNKIIGTTYGQAPSFSGYIQLNNFSDSNSERSKKLYFFLSLVGPYYAIMGSDESVFAFNSNKIFITNYWVASPENEYAQVYKLVETKLKEKFPEYYQIPFHLCQQKLEGLQIRYSDDKNLNCVFHALFNNQVNLNAEFIGDGLYGSDKWIRKGYNASNEDSWTIYPS